MSNLERVILAVVGSVLIGVSSYQVVRVQQLERQVSDLRRQLVLATVDSVDASDIRELTSEIARLSSSAPSPSNAQIDKLISQMSARLTSDCVRELRAIAHAYAVTVSDEEIEQHCR